MPPKHAPVTVIVPAYRASATIGRALAGVAAQTVPPRQVVVVDDGSGDGTAAAARACAGELAGIDLEVLEQAHAGAGMARNRALLGAREPVVAFLDADDEWLPTHLERSFHFMEDGDLVLTAHNGWQIDGDDETLIDGARRFGEGTDPFVTLYRKGFIDTCTVLARREALVAAGGFDPGLPNAQDFDMWLALLRRPGARFLVFDEPLSRYFVSAAGIMSHTSRRLACCLRIAARYAGDLDGRPGSTLASLWFRVLAVHYEALAVHRARREWAATLMIACRLPLSLLAMTWGHLFAGPPVRHETLEEAMAMPATETVTDDAPVLVMGWAWVIGIFAAYLWQFRDLVDPILAIFTGA